MLPAVTESNIYILRRQKRQIISSVLAFKNTFLVVSDDILFYFFVAPVSTCLKIDLRCFMVLLLSALNLKTAFC